MKPKNQQKATKKNLPIENKYFSYGLLVIFLTLVFFAASYKISGDDDFFWHLATGRYIIENMSVPDTDVFGFATQGVKWIPFEWGWDVLTFGINSIGGFNAVLVFRSVTFVLIFFLLYILLKKFKVNSLIAIIFLFALLVSVMDRLSPRPHVLTYLFFILLLYILLSFKYIDRDKYFTKLYFLPLIFLVWGNVHLGVLAGGLFLFVFTVTEILIYFKPKRLSSNDIAPLTKKQLSTLCFISFSCACVLLLNPHGISTYIYAYNHTQMKLLETVNEWKSPFSSDMAGFTATLYKTFLFCGVFILFYSYKKKDLLFSLEFIVFAIYSVRAIRFTVDYNILIFFFIVFSINYFVTNRKSFKHGTSGQVLSGIPAKVIIGLCIIYIISQIPSGNIYNSLKYYRPAGWGIDKDFIPVELFDFMKQNNISGKPFNQFGTGGYLVWNFPGEKNFIDSRNLNDEIFNEYNTIMSMLPGFEKKIEAYGFDYVIYLDPDLIRRPAELKTVIVSYLIRNPNWKLVFWDDKSFLFVKNIPKFYELINKYEFKIINPYTALFYKNEFEKNISENKEKAKEELKRKSETEPNGYLYQNLNREAARFLQGQ